MTGTQTDNSSHLIVSAMRRATMKYDSSQQRNITLVPGWNQFYRDKYSRVRDVFLIWRRAGKIRIGPDYKYLILTRNGFRDALRFVELNNSKQRQHIIREL